MYMSETIINSLAADKVILKFNTTDFIYLIS